MEKLEVLERLRNILKEEKEIVKREVEKRGSFRGEIEGISRNFCSIKVEKPVSEGTLLGFLDDGLHELGYVLRYDRNGRSAILKLFSTPEEESLKLVEMESLLSYDLQIQALDHFIENPDFPREVDVRTSGQKIEGLDEYQSDAVVASLSLEENEVMRVIGPPGTGKTTFIAYCAKIAMDEGKRVFIASHTNRAVDNALEKILEFDLHRSKYVVRVGRYWKTSGDVRKILLEYMAMRDVTSLMHFDLDSLAKEYSKIERKSLEILSKSRIVGSTLIKSGMYPLVDQHFDLVLIDEASQALISSALLSISQESSFVVVGDPFQLSPVLRTGWNSSKYSAFNFFSSKPLWLRNHYRSNEKIINFASRYVYGGKIKPHESCKNIKLEVDCADKGFRWFIIDPGRTVIFVSVDSRDEPMKKSRVNPKEAAVVGDIVRTLLDAGVEDVGVITPYIAQRDQIREIISVEVDTVDAFQGRERDVIVFSTTAVRNLRFACEKRRFNVAVTRARKKIIVVGNRKSFLIPENRKTLLYHFMNYARENNGFIEYIR
ncbi:hypothetical protein Asulf_01210 [Archaeoglobus sulfaticallidus PM70-1]|uniref:AAA+ ATPase domain-containing protein n=1 Tax=Archaeoglobus sulfaticallidus PM70-1 TaxID=387631 RepID=N0BDX2_9EURY|nr:AAA domain-containing protein [Archaeoglobus sulfaticallidus]AGK61208.1 hypothetical protein Asulf_01210 [Archaeoglobus sulfaticallidus PM70-1]